MIILKILFLTQPKYPTQILFSHPNITEVVLNAQHGLDFSGHYSVDREAQEPTKTQHGLDFSGHYTVDRGAKEPTKTQHGLDFSDHYTVGRGAKKATERSDIYYDIKTLQSLGTNCSTPVDLEAFTTEKTFKNQIFFIETSGRSKLSPRQACSVESAARVSNLHVQMILLSNTLDLTDNSTCYLYTSVSNINFYKIDLEKIYEKTPLQDLVQSNIFSNSKFKATHQSDALRLALIYKYGGFYSDMDAVTIRDLSNFQNVIGATTKNAKPATHFHLANGEFQFKGNHQILWETMEAFSKEFTGKKRVEVGPMLITRTIKNHFQVEFVETIKSETLTVLPVQEFYPIKSFEKDQFWPVEPKSFKYWAKLFENSSMVHFYGSKTNVLVIERDPSHEAYAVLGPRYCPISYWSSDRF